MHGTELVGILSSGVGAAVLYRLAVYNATRRR